MRGECFVTDCKKAKTCEYGRAVSHTHLDLRFILHSFGLSRGLKSCEQQLGIVRTDPLADVDDFLTILLWQDQTEFYFTSSSSSTSLDEQIITS